MTGTSPTVWGAAAGVILAFAALAFGFWGMILVAVLGFTASRKKAA